VEQRTIEIQYMPARILDRDDESTRERRRHRSGARASKRPAVERVRERAPRARERVYTHDGGAAVGGVGKVSVASELAVVLEARRPVRSAPRRGLPLLWMSDVSVRRGRRHTLR
jgi:hypothetical protein